MADDPCYPWDRTEFSPKPVHVYPLFGKRHKLKGTGCWCEPRLSMPCPQCDGDKDCWRCHGDGWVEATVPGDALMVIHNAVKEYVSNVSTPREK
jgi:hypothetical protein